MSDTNDSRIEKLLKAILGQEVQLEPRESRVERLLYAILTGGSHDEPTLSEMEDILLCILHGERYDGPTSSRINALLKVKANGGSYDEPRLSRIEELIYEWINGGDISTYTGTLPAALQTVAGYLESYKIWGNTVQTGTPTPENPIMPEGVGERTENLFDETWFNDDTQLSASSGLPVFYTGRIAIRNPINVSNIDTVTLTYSLGTTAIEYFMYSIFSGNTLIERMAGKTSGDIIDVTNADTLYICLYIGGRNITVNDVQWIMLNLGSVPLPYEPYGYKLPILSNDTTTDIYIGDAQLAKDEYVDSVGKIYRYVDGTLTPTDPPTPFPQIPTFAGETTISYGGTGAQPEKVELKYMEG